MEGDFECKYGHMSDTKIDFVIKIISKTSLSVPINGVTQEIFQFERSAIPNNFNTRFFKTTLYVFSILRISIFTEVI